MALTEAQTSLVLIGLKAITVALGVLIVYLGMKAYRSSRRKPIFYLALGMLVMTLGAISEGAAYQGLSWGLGESHLFEAVVTLIAFAILVYSLYA